MKDDYLKKVIGLRIRSTSCNWRRDRGPVIAATAARTSSSGRLKRSRRFCSTAIANAPDPPAIWKAEQRDTSPLEAPGSPAAHDAHTGPTICRCAVDDLATFRSETASRDPSPESAAPVPASFAGGSQSRSRDSNPGPPAYKAHPWLSGRSPLTSSHCSREGSKAPRDVSVCRRSPELVSSPVSKRSPRYDPCSAGETSRPALHA